MDRPLMLGTEMATVLALSGARVPPPAIDNPGSPVSSSPDQAPRAPELRYLETAAVTDSVAQDPMGQDHKGSHPDPSGIGVLTC
jgi:hypothetical protein